MKVSLTWLRDYTPVDVPLREAVRALIDAGIEVGEVTDDAAGIVVARVLALEPVPGSNHLLIADLDVGPVPPQSLVDLGMATTPLRVVTGAPNLRVDDLVPYAPPGSRPPAMDEPLGVRQFKGRLRSPGMLCSAAELGLGNDGAGILVLDHGSPGQALREVEDTDAVLDLEVTTNRPDCLCHVGIARELAAVLREQLTEPPALVPAERESAASAQQRVSLRIEDPSGCPRFMLRVIENVAVRESPAWMQRRLRAIGLRPINAVVDVTNYVAHELGQPLHAFDYDKLAALGSDAKQPAVVVRRAREGERLRCLDGVERVLGGADMVVCAGDVAASLGGIIGGADTAVGADTRSVLLEAASWEPTGIRATARRLGVRTDASTLFEKGLSDTLPPQALERAAAIIAELAGAHVLREVIDQWPRPLPALQPITLTGAILERLLGMRVDASDAATALARLGFAVEQDGATLRVTPPHFRRDVTIAEDVVEEVGRSVGYARLPSTLPGRRSPITHLAPPPVFEDSVRDVCAGAGYDEAITLSFVPRQAHVLLPGAGEGYAPIALQNPLSEEWSVLRTSQLPGLAAALATNVNGGVDEPALFEVGRAFWEGARTQPVPGSTPGGEDASLPSLPLEPLLLSVVAQTDAQSPETAAERLRRVQALLTQVAGGLGGLQLIAEDAQLTGFRSGRCARLRIGGEECGVLGELEGVVVEAMGLRGRVVAGELRLDAIAEASRRPPRFLPPPRFPAILRDLAVSVPTDQTAGAALAVIRAAGGDLLEAADLYDEYRGDRLDAGRKGWTFHLRFRAPARTLTGDEAQSALDAVVAALEKACRAQVRS